LGERERERERESAETARERERAGSTKERGEMRVFFIRIFKGIVTVFPNALGNTVETQWRRLNIGLLLWAGGVFVVFSLFSLNIGKGMPYKASVASALTCSTLPSYFLKVWKNAWYMLTCVQETKKKKKKKYNMQLAKHNKKTKKSIVISNIFNSSQ
jgi:hypothetical protein